MCSQTLISILVLVTLHCSTHVISNNVSEKLKLANKLNMLVNHSGWRLMDVKILKNNNREIIADPISEILEAISSNQNPVDESNALERHKDIWAVLLCKYSEIINNYKVHIQNLIWVCQEEKSTSDSFQSYYDCFRLLLIKLHSISPIFKCMKDALDLIYSLGPQMKPVNKGRTVMDAVRNFTDFTLTIGPTISSKLSKQGTTVEVVNQKIHDIGEYITYENQKNIYSFIIRNCVVSKNKKMTEHNLMDFFLIAKKKQMIPPELTIMQYVIDEIDSYMNENLGKWFYDLGFAYGIGDRLTIGTN